MELKKLNTIQKDDKLNDVYSLDEIGPGGTRHEYIILEKDTPIAQVDDLAIYSKDKKFAGIYFQKGPRDSEQSLHGVMDTDLLEIVRDRYKGFQSGPYPSEEGAEILSLVEKALKLANQRIQNRKKRNVLGKNEK